jgi:hypothetical protein
MHLKDIPTKVMNRFWIFRNTPSNSVLNKTICGTLGHKDADQN